MTDANLFLGRLDPEYFLGGRMKLDLKQSETALASLADQLNMSVADVASSVVEIANENMASAIKMVSIERGHDPRRFTLFAFGGAGPVHAAAVARSLRIPHVLIPIHPGNASAMGMLIADLRVDKVWTQAFKSNDIDASVVEKQFRRIEDAAVTELRSEGFSGTPGISYSINMRYLGQNYEHEVPVPTDAITSGRLQEAYDAFISMHEAQYGYAIENEIIELVSFRVTTTGERHKPDLTVTVESTSQPTVTERSIHFRGTGSLPASVLRRYDMPAGMTVDGPAVLEEPGSTTIVEPGMKATVLNDGQILIDTGISVQNQDAS